MIDRRTRNLWLVVFLLLPLARVAQAQEPAPLPPDGFAVATDENETGTDGETDEPREAAPPQPDRPLPEVPETTVVGRPEPFPSRPLAESTTLTPTQTETPISEVGSALTVIDRQQIERSEQTDVAEVLRSVPGLDVVQQGGPGGLTSVFIRGANSQHTKVLIDGIPVNDPSNATRSFDFSFLSTDDIERVEVLRGPQSTLYGSDAIGGVINIITARGEGPLSVRGDFLGGSYGTRREAVNLSGGNDLVYYSASGSYFDQDGFSAGDLRFNENTESDGVRLGTVAGRFGITPSENFDVDYVFRFIDRDTDIDDLGFGNGEPPTDNPIRQTRAEAFFNRVQARLALVEGFWEQKVGYNFTDYDRLDTDPGLFGTPVFLGQTREMDYQSNFILTENNTLTVGADYLHEDASTIDTFGRTDEAQHQASVYFQDQVRVWDRWFTTVGFRWDDHSKAGSASTYRITSLYRFRETGTALHGSIGSGFRAPSLAENAFAFGNEDLRPERSKGWDCGLEQSLFCGKLVVDGTYFRNDFVDLIQFDFATFELENIGLALSSGVELTALWEIDPETTLTANYTHTHTEDRDTGFELRRRPAHTASLGINRSLWCDRANVNLNLLYVGPRLDSSDRSVYLDEYFLLNLAGWYDLGTHCRLFARLDNVLDQDYEEVFGFDTPALSFYGGVSLRY